MNASDFIYDESDEIQVPARKSSGNASFKSSGSNRKSFGRRGKSPKQFNGMHRRRTKKIRW